MMRKGTEYTKGTRKKWSEKGEETKGKYDRKRKKLVKKGEERKEGNDERKVDKWKGKRKGWKK